MKRMTLVAFLLLVPLLSVLVGAALQYRWDSQLRDAFRRARPDADPALVQAVTIRRVCADPSMARDISSICDEYGLLELLSSGGVVATAVGIILVGAIWVAGGVAGRNRVALLVVFKPGLYIAVLVLIGLTFLQAALAIGVLYFGESALIQRVNVGVILAIGLGAILGAFGMVRATLTVLGRSKLSLLAKVVERKASPPLWDLTERVAADVGAPAPSHITVGLNPSFFVTESEVQCLDGGLRGRTLYLSLPLCRILSLDELRAVIGHELGHYKGLDTQFSTKFYPIYRRASEALATLGAVADSGGVGRAISVLPALSVLSHFLEAFSVAENTLGRERELAADAVGAKAGSVRGLASALVKLHSFSGFWEAVVVGMRNLLSKEQQFINASDVFVQIVNEHASSEALVGLDERRVPHPTDSHPPLTVRLNALGLDLREVSGDALRIAPTEPGAQLIGSLEELEKELTNAHHALIFQLQ